MLVVMVDWWLIVLPALLTGSAAIIAGYVAARTQAQNAHQLLSRELAEDRRERAKELEMVREQRFLDERRTAYAAVLAAYERYEQAREDAEEAHAEVARLTDRQADADELKEAMVDARDASERVLSAMDQMTSARQQVLLLGPNSVRRALPGVDGDYENWREFLAAARDDLGLGG